MQPYRTGKGHKHRDIDFPVLHAGMRGYISIIAILRGIAAGNQESLFGHRPVRHFDLISFRFIFETP